LIEMDIESKVIVFSAGEYYLAVPIKNIESISHYNEIKISGSGFLSQKPKFKMEYNNQEIHIIDLRKVFHSRETSASNKTCVTIIKTSELTFGIVTDYALNPYTGKEIGELEPVKMKYSTIEETLPFVKEILKIKPMEDGKEAKPFILADMSKLESFIADIILDGKDEAS